MRRRRNPGRVYTIYVIEIVSRLREDTLRSRPCLRRPNGHTPGTPVRTAQSRREAGGDEGSQIRAEVKAGFDEGPATPDAGGGGERREEAGGGAGEARTPSFLGMKIGRWGRNQFTAIDDCTRIRVLKIYDAGRASACSAFVIDSPLRPFSLKEES
jgi:hypothetical protein